MTSRVPATRRRKPHFSEADLNMLADPIVEHADQLFTTNRRRQSQLREKAIWEVVAQKVTAVGSTPCTVRDCRKRCDDLRLRVQNLLSAQRTQGIATGGGTASPIHLQAWEETCSSVLHLESIDGVSAAEAGGVTSEEAGTSSDNEAGQPSTSRATRPCRRRTTITSTQDPIASTGRRESAIPSTSLQLLPIPVAPAAQPPPIPVAPAAQPPPIPVAPAAQQSPIPVAPAAQLPPIPVHQQPSSPRSQWQLQPSHPRSQWHLQPNCP
ncbi:myb-related transcription factor, partner of profilin-like [Ambystoma mexicanum]|uniref:myb-related transcription factor, partner of profilin-like n=1 Tax=Ambystoma mexicanum TaxID=8296 RepID=UPI0037E8D02B